MFDMTHSYFRRDSFMCTCAQMLKWWVKIQICSSWLYAYAVRDSCVHLCSDVEVVGAKGMETILLSVVRYSYTHLVRVHVSMQFVIHMSIQFVSGM